MGVRGHNMTEADKRKVRRLANAGVRPSQIANQLRISYATALRYSKPQTQDETAEEVPFTKEQMKDAVKIQSEVPRAHLVTQTILRSGLTADDKVKLLEVILF